MRTPKAQALLLAALAGAAGLSSSRGALASNPLEYPDNGAAAFSRGGAWLGTANEPIATHYNPAALATQKSGFSIDQLINFPTTCFYRKGPGDTIIGPNDEARARDGSGLPARIYLPVCNEREGFPNTIPSISLAFRATKKLGFGIAIIPPATYGTADSSFPAVARGYNLNTNSYEMMPAPYRYMQLQQLSTIVFPTVSVGYELFQNFRVGVGFISGIGVINITTMGQSTFTSDTIDRAGDHFYNDSFSNLRTKDLFIPGVIASVHWSVLPQLDVAAWARVMDSLRASQAELALATDYFDGGSGRPQPWCTDLANCPSGNAAPNNSSNNPAAFKKALTGFKYPIPPEVRVGVRFHQPRTKERMAFESGGVVRDPLHDDLFDIELNASYAFNSVADTIEVRFASTTDANGAIIGATTTRPTGVSVPPNADRWTGYRDSVGLRLGGQWNAIADKFAVRAGAWLETRSQEPEWLTLQPVGATRWGFGGGIVLRQGFIDFSIGYQRHESAGLNNHGDGRMRAVTGTGGGTNLCGTSGTFDAACDFGKDAKDMTQFRSLRGINGGQVTFYADVFTLGATVRF